MMLQASGVLALLTIVAPLTCAQAGAAATLLTRIRQPLDDASGCAGHPAGTVCRLAAGPCDVEEACDGVAPDCPPDAVRDAATVCRPAAGACDIEERCAGEASCPADVKSTAVCRRAMGRCDVSERCDGASDACPPDAFHPASFRLSCDDGNACTVGNHCSGTSSACEPRARVVCDDPCHTGMCDPRDGCLPHEGAKALTCRVEGCSRPALLLRLRRLARRIERAVDAQRPPRAGRVRRLTKLLGRCAQRTGDVADHA